MDSLKIAIVIPAYNEENTITNVVNSVKDLASVIVVSDNSKDKTAVLAEKAGAVVVQLEKNRGYEGAIEEGFKKAVSLGIDFVVTMDADGQHSRASVKAVIDQLKATPQPLVLGVRPGVARTSEFFYDLYFRLRFGVKDALCGLKCYQISLFKHYGSFDNQKLVGAELMMYGLKQKCAYTEVPISIEAREGDSRYGTTLKANLKIFRALYRAIMLDFKMAGSR